MSNDANLLGITRVDPSARPAPVTKSNTVNLTYHGEELWCRGLYIGGVGDVAVLDDQGTSVTYTGLLAGVLYPISTNRVMSTNTTATNIVAVF